MLINKKLDYTVFYVDEMWIQQWYYVLASSNGNYTKINCGNQLFDGTHTNN